MYYPISLSALCNLPLFNLSYSHNSSVISMVQDMSVAGGHRINVRNTRVRPHENYVLKNNIETALIHAMRFYG
jgi:hypothetical protein